MLYIKGMERSQIKLRNDDGSNKKQYYYGKARAKHKNKNKLEVDEDLHQSEEKTFSHESNNEKGFSSRMTSKSRKSAKTFKHFKKNKAKLNMNKITPKGLSLKTSVSSLGNKQRKSLPYHKIANSGVLHLSKSSGDVSMDLTKKITEKDKDTTNRVNNIAKREVYQSSNEPTNESEDERIKKGSIFSDIATAFKHIQQDQESKYNTKKSDLEKITKKPGR